MQIRLDRRMFSSLMSAFARLRERVIFKAYVDEDALASVKVPDNVLVCQTIPLATLLAHPKTVLLINQAGSNRCVLAVSCKEELDFRDL